MSDAITAEDVPFFAVGEIAFVVPFETGPIDLWQYKCTEVEITGPLQRHGRSKSGLVYPVLCADGTEAYANPWILRKRIPPEQLEYSPEDEVTI